MAEHNGKETPETTDTENEPEQEHTHRFEDKNSTNGISGPENRTAISHESQSEKEFVFVPRNSVPEPDSPEIRAVNYNTTILGWCIHFFWRFFAPNSADFSTWQDQIRREMKVPESVGDATLRVCLEKSLLAHWKAIIDKEGLENLNTRELKQAGCITEEEAKYIISRDASQEQIRRRILTIIRTRDYRTLLKFLWVTLASDKDLIDNIISLFRHNVLSGYVASPKCTRCVIAERVSITLVVDKLNACSTNLLPFVTRVSEVDEPVKQSVSKQLWDELFTLVNDQFLCKDVLEEVTAAVQNSEFYSDIVEMLHEDQKMNKNSFICRCRELTSETTCRMAQNSKENSIPSFSLCTQTESSARNELHNGNVQVVNLNGREKKLAPKRKISNEESDSEEKTNSAMVIPVPRNTDVPNETSNLSANSVLETESNNSDSWNRKRQKTESTGLVPMEPVNVDSHWNGTRVSDPVLADQNKTDTALSGPTVHMERLKLDSHEGQQLFHSSKEDSEPESGVFMDTSETLARDKEQTVPKQYMTRRLDHGANAHGLSSIDCGTQTGDTNAVESSKDAKPKHSDNDTCNNNPSTETSSINIPNDDSKVAQAISQISKTESEDRNAETTDKKEM